MEDRDAIEAQLAPNKQQTAFSLSRFIPLLQERILVLNPFTRMFLVQWITLLDSIPDLELISYLPSFLDGLFKFLNDTNQDVVTSTQHVLERFLDEIKLIARVKRDLADNHKLSMTASGPISPSEAENKAAEPRDEESRAPESRDAKSPDQNGGSDGSSDSGSELSLQGDSGSGDGDWIPGQDVYVDHPKILAILVEFLRDTSGERAVCPPRILAS